MTRTAAVYVRISQDREGAGLGVDRQRDDCLALAGKLGWTVAATHVDNDLSAYSGKPRPQYKALLADLEDGRADAVLVWHTDRLHRSPRELEEYVDLCERRKIVTQTVKAGELDLATPSGRAVARTLGAWSRFEVEHKSDRTKRAQLQAAQAGRWHGGSRPFGWRVHPDGTADLDAAEAREVATATSSILAGASLGSVIGDWNARGVTTSTGRQWQYATTRQVLTRPRNAGLSTYGGEVVGRSIWPALVPEDSWRALCALLDDPDRRTSTTNRMKHLLVSLALCGVCGTPVRTGTVHSNRRTGSKRTVYRCRTPGGGHVARSVEPVNDFVSGVILARLRQPDLVTLSVPIERGGDVDALRDEAVALRHRLREVADAFADGTITRSQLERATERVRDRLAAVEGEMAAVTSGSAIAGLMTEADPPGKWQALDLDRQRAIITELTTVTIMPSGKRGNAFDPELIRVDWKTS